VGPALTSGHVIWFDAGNADGCALICLRSGCQAHDEFDFPREKGGLCEEGPITIGRDVRPAPESISITRSHPTGPQRRSPGLPAASITHTSGRSGRRQRGRPSSRSLVAREST